MIINTKQRLMEMMNKVAGMPLNEIDFETEFGDVKQTCINIDQLKEILNNTLKNYNLPPNKRTKQDLLIHNKKIPRDESGEIDVMKFINDCTVEPPMIISEGNAKMLRSANDNFYTVTIGLPAFRGLVIDMENNTFHIVNTCPGAGTCVKPCYARRGNYLFLPNVLMKQTRVLNLLLNNPQRFKEKLKNEIIKLYKKNREKEMRFRWNDSDDFFTRKYYDIGVEIMKELKDMGFVVKPYAHTKIADIYNTNRASYIANPETTNPKDLQITMKPDFIISFSVDANKTERDKVNLYGAKTSEIVNTDIFADLFQRNANNNRFVIDDMGQLVFKNANGMNVLKQRISDEYNVDINTLYSHNEWLKTPEMKNPVYNVIVLPKGETDIPTQRHDVLRTFFLQH